MILSMIVAVSENGGIGKQGEIPWRLSADLKLFKQRTMGHHLILGRKTYESIGRPLPGRKMVVISRQPDYQAEDCQVVSSLDAAINLAEGAGESEAFIGGGGEIYKLAMPKADRIYLTRVHTEVESDTFFPELDWKDWEALDVFDHPADGENEFAFTVLILERKSD